MTPVLAVFAAAWPLIFLIIGMCNVDWNDRGGL